MFSEVDLDLKLDWQLPWVMPYYPSGSLYYPFLRGNIDTQIRVMTNKLYFHYPSVSHEHLDLQMSTINL